jgi:hypothetical protein
VVQIVEVTDLGGLRVVVWPFRRRGTPLSFLLFPMIHLGEPRFYAEVTERLRLCDLLVVEGVGGHAASLRALTSYRRLAGVERLGLVLQDIDVRALDVELIRPDLDAEGFDEGWRHVPWGERAAARVVFPAVNLALRLVGNRRMLAEHMATNDLPEGLDLEDVPFAGIEDLIVDQRDRRLVDALTALDAQRSHEQITVGVVYGAGHMRAVIRALWALGYRPGGGEWLTVFAILDR